MDARPHGGEDIERRWQPTENPDEWSRATRQRVFASAKRCIANVMAAGIAADARFDHVSVHSATYHELHICVDAYARGLYTLGQTGDGVVALILVAAREAALPNELHPAIGPAIERWCREARTSEPPAGTDDGA